MTIEEVIDGTTVEMAAGTESLVIIDEVVDGMTAETDSFANPLLEPNDTLASYSDDETKSPLNDLVVRHSKTQTGLL